MFLYTPKNPKRSLCFAGGVNSAGRKTGWGCAVGSRLLMVSPNKWHLKKKKKKRRMSIIVAGEERREKRDLPPEELMDVFV